VRKHPSINGLGGREYIIGKDTYCEEAPQYQRRQTSRVWNAVSMAWICHQREELSGRFYEDINGVGRQEYESEMVNGIKKLDEVLQEPSIGASLMMEY
jgi:hypothetical protein